MTAAMKSAAILSPIRLSMNNSVEYDRNKTVFIYYIAINVLLS